MNLTVRRATPADADTVAAFNLALAWETEHKRLDPSVVAAGVRAVLDDPARGFYLLAVTDANEVVGQLMITFEWSDWRNGWFWWVQSVYVRADVRGRGVLRALYGQVQRLAAADPAVIGLRLYVEQDNAPARAAYMALGLKPTTYRVMEEYPLPGRSCAMS